MSLVSTLTTVTAFTIHQVAGLSFPINRDHNYYSGFEEAEGHLDTWYMIIKGT